MVNLDSDTKEKFDRLQPDEYNQSEFVAELLEVYEKSDLDALEYADTEDIVESIVSKVAPNVEMAAYKGISEGIEDKT